jgi:hypothetical protein
LKVNGKWSQVFTVSETEMSINTANLFENGKFDMELVVSLDGWNITRTYTFTLGNLAIDCRVL